MKHLAFWSGYNTPTLLTNLHKMSFRDYNLTTPSLVHLYILSASCADLWVGQWKPSQLPGIF